MKNLHTAALLIALSLGTATEAQEQYFLHISGHHTPCTADVQDNVVTIQSLPGTFPDYDIEVPINANCYYTVILEVNSIDYGFVITSGCSDPITTVVQDSAISVPLGTTIALTVDFNCGQAPPTCEANFTYAQEMSDGEPVPFSMVTTNLSSGIEPITFNWLLPDFTWSNDVEPGFVFTGPGNYDLCLQLVDANNCTSTLCTTVVVQEDGTIGDVQAPDCEDTPGGSALPGTPCEIMGITGFWNTDCECIPDNTEPCTAGFWVIQAYEFEQEEDTTSMVPIPFELWIWNLSNGGTGNYQFTWDFGDGNSSTEAFPTHVYADSGPYTLCLTMADDGGCTDTYCDDISVNDDGLLGMMPDGGLVRAALTINVVQELPMSVTERPRMEVTRLWPNPVEDQLSLMLNSSRSGEMLLSILDMNGREVASTNVGLAAGSNLLPLDVANLDRGMYIIRMVSGTNQASMRFVKR